MYMPNRNSAHQSNEGNAKQSVTMNGSIKHSKANTANQIKAHTKTKQRIAAQDNALRATRAGIGK